MKTITTGSDFSGVGAFDYAIERVAKAKRFKHKRKFACDMDKFARQSYTANHGEPEYYPLNVYDRIIPNESLDIYMTSPPCQSFSLAGNRKGKDDERGVLFFNSYEFIKQNQPRFFIFENVKGLLSDDNGNTFQEWLNYLGGKSINGLPLLFKDENAVDYHIYWKVLNSKKHGVPQNRERVFIIGIRDDKDNVFTWPKEEHLKLRLKDILENEADSKYFLSEKAVNSIILNEDNLQQSKINPEIASTIQCPGNSCGTYKGMTAIDVTNLQGNDVSNCIRTGGKMSLTKKHNWDIVKLIDSKIRRLTPRECFRLQDFPESFKFVVSDSQLYKQAGNSITVRVLELIIEKLKL